MLNMDAVLLIIPLPSFKLKTSIFIRICLSTHREGTVNQLNPAYSHSVHSHLYSKSTHSSTVARLSFYWSLGLHCAAKWIPLSRDPACHSTNNKSNKHRQRPVCFFIFSFLDADTMSLDLFTAPVLWNRLSLYEMPLYDPNNQFRQSMKGYCFFCSSFALLPLLLWRVYGVFFFFLCYASTVFKQEHDNVGEWCARMALHCSTWCSWDYFLKLVCSSVKESGTVATFVLQ